MSIIDCNKQFTDAINGACKDDYTSQCQKLINIPPAEIGTCNYNVTDNSGFKYTGSKKCYKGEQIFIKDAYQYLECPSISKDKYGNIVSECDFVSDTGPTNKSSGNSKTSIPLYIYIIIAILILIIIFLFMKRKN